jgi:dTDP-4-dehydrorhamnose reductase
MFPTQTLDELPNGKVLVLGATGLLGANVFDIFDKKVETVGTFLNHEGRQKNNLHRLNASNFADLDSFIQTVAPATIVNCLGLTDVEICESRPEASWKLNAAIPTHIAKLARARNIKFLHISTDHFFSEIEQPRYENDSVMPINQYGYSKYQAEKSILSCNPNSLVLRTNFFGHSKSGRRSLLDFALTAFAGGKIIHGFDDVIFSPVGVNEISRFLSSKKAAQGTGVLNFASTRPLSKYEFLILIARAQGYDESQVLRSKISFSNLNVNRPSYLALNPSRLMGEFKYPMPPIEIMLKEELTNIP